MLVNANGELFLAIFWTLKQTVVLAIGSDFVHVNNNFWVIVMDENYNAIFIRLAMALRDMK